MQIFKKREAAEIPSSSLADIGFLLLVFFLLVTTIDIDTGIGLVLPPATDHPPPEVKERNMLKILINREGLVQIDGTKTPLSEVKEKVMEFVDNNGNNPRLSESPKQAIVSDRETLYSAYIDMFDEIVGAYEKLRGTGHHKQSLGNHSTPWTRTAKKRSLLKTFTPKTSQLLNQIKF